MMETKSPQNPVRLNRFLARHGLCSRRKADELIQSGRISIDGMVCRELGTEIDPEKQRIAVDGKELEDEPPRIYILLNKPLDVVTTKSDPQQRKTVLDMLPQEITRLGIFPVGRLDSDSEGLLLLSNDGDWTQILLHPGHQVWKEYQVQTDKPMNKEIVKELKTGIILEDKKTLPSKIIWEPEKSPTNFRISIREGRNRQIRKMCQHFHLNVVSLRRLSIGPIQLGNLPKGQWRKLTETEIQSVFALDKTDSEAKIHRIST